MSCSLSPSFFFFPLSKGTEKNSKKKIPQGVDMVWEAVGGATFDACASSIKPVTGRIIFIGMIQEYHGSASKEGKGGAGGGGLPELLLWRGATAKEFFLLHHLSRAPRHLTALEQKLESGKLRVAVDDGSGRGGAGKEKKRFEGVESVAEAVE